ncbi:DUF4118 domain-containing protein [Nitrosomonas sp. HPC101]|uniref:DUF4118 domain-containing protein n=1 Tax=Nitrosomonas sp. HPC101 TaxID=1658667 RepID=UPI001F03571B|nr:DUF4118 domain-containing protein [Nitrosomonas sp. HPC101]
MGYPVPVAGFDEAYGDAAATENIFWCQAGMTNLVSDSFPTAAPDDQRPDPDVLLQQVQQEEARAQRGRLKIFFGASAGVGKTYAMLSAARTAHAQGVPLIIGVVETHGRAETEALAVGLPLLPRKVVSYRGHTLKEFDLDAALAFGTAHAGGPEPPLVLLDELAHSNIAGSRHPKRWQDVEELLAAGIDVWSTMNVQHLESLNDIVGGITGIRVRETVPDTLFDTAEEVVIVDLPPDELLARLAAGKIYIPEQIRHAAANFFRKGNLIALRELALRRTADRVDTQMQSWRRTLGVTDGRLLWSTRDAILACVGPGMGGEAVVRTAARLAAQTNLPWHAVFVDTSSQRRVDEDERQQALRVLKLAQELGATIAMPAGTDAGEVLIRYARENNLSRLVLGWRSGRRYWRSSLIEQLADQTPDMDVLQVPLPDDKRKSSQTRRFRMDPALVYWQGYVIAIAVCMLVAVAATLLHGTLDMTNIVMLFLMAVVGVALRYGRGPAMLTTFLGVALFDFFFVPPHLSFNVSDIQYLITFAVMLAVALVIGQLTAGLHSQAEVATERERRVRGLYQMSRELSAALLAEKVAEVSAHFIATEFAAKSALLVADRNNQLQIQPGASTDVDMAVAQWCFDKGEAAGHGTYTLPSCACLMLPLKAPMRLRGVLAVQPVQTMFTPEQRQLLDTCASLLAISLERIHYIQVAQDSIVQMESERLRNSLLSAISHDLRTPLASLVGLADTLNLVSPPLPAPQAEIAGAIRQSARRMSILVNNLLDMAHLESGKFQLHCEWLPLEEIVGSALAACTSLPERHPVEVQLAEDLPLLYLDAVLFERVLTNLLENAVKYTPAGTAIRISAKVLGSSVCITIDDEGPGLPVGREESVFGKFERGSRETAIHGVGLGLAICRAIVQVHGGRIYGENRFEQGHVAGARFVIILPRGEPPQDDGSEAQAVLADRDNP